MVSHLYTADETDIYSFTRPTTHENVKTERRLRKSKHDDDNNNNDTANNNNRLNTGFW